MDKTESRDKGPKLKITDGWDIKRGETDGEKRLSGKKLGERRRKRDGWKETEGKRQRGGDIGEIQMASQKRGWTERKRKGDRQREQTEGKNRGREMEEERQRIERGERHRREIQGGKTDGGTRTWI